MHQYVAGPWTSTKSHSSAMVAFTPSTDASTTTGHQVDLTVGTNDIVVTVTAEDGNAIETYTVTVTRFPGGRPGAGRALRRG